MKVILLGLVGLYQKTLSPFWPARCRYSPSCSAYAQEAVERFGPWKGSWLALKRLARCQPWGGLGYDPVPLAQPGFQDVAHTRYGQ